MSAAARAAPPAVLCLVNPQAMASDPNRPGSFEWPATLAALKRDATNVCKALAGTADIPKVPFDEQGLLDRLAKLPADRPRIVFYAGHGIRDAKTNQVSLPVAGGAVPLGRVLAALDARAANTPPGSWSVLIMNSCESAYADLREAKGQLSVIGSGWGRVSAAPDRGDDPQSLTRFGAALTDGLSGLADAAPIGNCDGVITDGELSRFIDERMARAARADTELWRLAPVAAIRRNRAVDVPLAQLATPARGCQKAEAKAEPKNRPGAAPSPPLASAFTARLDSVARLRAWAAPEAARPLVAVLAPAAAGAIVSGLAKIGDITGVEIVPVNPLRIEDVAAAERRAASVPTFWLEIRPGQAGEWYFELVRGRDRATTWAASFPADRPAQEIVAAVAPRLPRELRVLRPFGRSDGQLRVTANWTGGALETADWGSLAAGNPTWQRVELKEPRPGACPDFAGLCFDLPSDTTGRLEPLFLRRVAR